MLLVALTACTRGRTIRTLQTDVSDLRHALDAARERLDAIEGRADALDAAREDLTARASTAEQRAAVDRRRLAELSALVGRDRREDVRHRSGIEQWQTWVDARVTAVERRAGLPRPDPPGTAARGAAATDDEVKSLLKNVHAKLADGDPSTARELAESGLAVHGERRAAAELRYLIGAAWVAEGQAARAVEALHFFIEAHPDSRWVAPARLYLAESFVALGDRPTAAVVLEDLVRLHPDAPEAATAVERLSALKGAM